MTELYQEPESKEKGPTIKFPTDIDTVRRLQLKLAEYNRRLGEQIKEHRYRAPEAFSDTKYKIAILEELLLNGEVNTYELSRALQKEDGQLIAEAFNSACRVIQNYSENAGKGNKGGTGLPELRK